jgi:hypothetical protein
MLRRSSTILSIRTRSCWSTRSQCLTRPRSGLTSQRCLHRHSEALQSVRECASSWTGVRSRWNSAKHLICRFTLRAIQGERGAFSTKSHPRFRSTQYWITDRLPKRGLLGFQILIAVPRCNCSGIDLSTAGGPYRHHIFMRCRENSRDDGLRLACSEVYPAYQHAGLQAPFADRLARQTIASNSTALCTPVMQASATQSPGVLGIDTAAFMTLCSRPVFRIKTQSEEWQ